MQALASRAQQLSDLIVQANTTTGAVARQSVALQQALELLPDTLNRSTTTFAGLDSTLDALDPLVAKSKIAARRLEPFAASLNKFAKVAVPTVTALSDLIHNPAGTGDLTTLFEETPKLAKLAATAFPNLIQAMNASQTQLDNLREYTPDVIAALTNVGQASGYYDANGHYVRVQPTFFAFGTDGSNQLVRAVAGRPLPGSADGHDRAAPVARFSPRPTDRRRAAVAGCHAAARPRPDHETARPDRNPASGSRPGPRSRPWRAPRERPGGDPYQVRAIFDDASFAVQGEQVRVAGAPVGSIASLDVCVAHTPRRPGTQNKAAVTLEIDDARFAPFHANATCAIRPQSLIGEMYVDCNPGTAATPALHRIDSGPGKGDYYLPVTRTSSPVDFDIVQDIYQEPVAQRLAIILNELGTGLAARGSDLNAVIHRADPALGNTDQVLKILAGQNRELAKLATDSDDGARAAGPAAKGARRLHRAGEHDLGRRARQRARTSRGRSSCFPGFLCASCGR